LVFIRQNALFALNFLGFAVLTVGSSLMDSIYVARRRAGFVLILSAINGLTKVALVIASSLVFYTFGIVTSWTIGLAVAMAISLFLLLPRVEPGYRPAPSLNTGQVKGLTRYTTQSYVASLLSRGPTMVLPILVLNVLGTESNAYFFVAWRIAELLFTIPWAVSQSLFAEGSFSPHTLRKNAARSIKFTLLLSVTATVLFIVCAKWFLLAFGPSYSSSSLHLVWLLSLASVPMGIIHVYISVLRVQDRLREMVTIRSFVAIAIPVSSLLVMPASGIIGIGYVWLGLHTTVAIFSVIRLRTLLKWSHRAENDNGENTYSF
jgi:O-antigen/teichoic acid export membrane protein